MKPASREPQSWTMACLTAAEVVSGPGRQQQRIAGFGSGRGRCHGADRWPRPPYPSSIYSICSHIGFLYMTPTQLRAFHLVAESGSFSAAARASGAEPAQPFGPGDGAGEALSSPPVRSARPHRRADGDRPATARHHHAAVRRAGRGAGAARRRAGADPGPSADRRRLRPPRRADHGRAARRGREADLRAGDRQLRRRARAAAAPRGRRRGDGQERCPIRACMPCACAPTASCCSCPPTMRWRSGAACRCRRWPAGRWCCASAARSRAKCLNRRWRLPISGRRHRRRADPRGRARGGGGRLRHRRGVRERAGRRPAVPPDLVADADLDVAEYAVCLQERRRVALVRAFMDEATRLAAGT